MALSPKISIITVVFNDRDHIEKTILSVLNQTYKNIEYIIVDGESTDGTLEVICGFNKIAVIISEPDNGLYDAMNKGLQVATGDYVWYLNSGDEVYSNDTLEHMVEGLQGMPDIIYGGSMIISGTREEIGERRLKPPAQLNWRSFRKGMVVSHQSLLVKRGIAVGYNLDYHISADIDWAIRVAKKASQIHNANLTLSRFMEGGISEKNIKAGLKERFRIMTRYYGFIPTLLRHFLFGIRLTNFYLRYRRI